MVVSSPQHGENTAFFSSLSVRRFYGLGALPVIPLGLEKKRLPFPEIRLFSIVPLSTNGLSTVLPSGCAEAEQRAGAPFLGKRSVEAKTEIPFLSNHRKIILF
ncbi:hypothetical protein [uncultured Bilophila sp.]|uniref:hypothetical protein n=1 Tax=uncultured Bilophila sp. TaxID=529385 RepID=UPI00266EE599|nr:hypothetical protein [uncultured Bilophila sp.]